MLTPGGVFLFDVPNYPLWAMMYLAGLDGDPIPFSMDHVRRTLFGWGRWPGDEHKYGWSNNEVYETLETCGFDKIRWPSSRPFSERTYRSRFTNPEDAHLYVAATR